MAVQGRTASLFPGMYLASFLRPLSVAIVGASGGIGSEFVRQISGMQGVSRIVALSRTTRHYDDERIAAVPVDLTNEESIDGAVATAARMGPFGLVVIASGLLHDRDLQPEKTMGQISYAHMSSVFATNAIGPAVLAARFLPLMRTGTKTVLAALSARVGSITDNRLGGWASYRASKAALNMVLKTYSIEQARRNRHCAVIALHPGTVDTDLSAPFNRGVPADKLLSKEHAVARMLDVIDSVDAAATGGFFAWDGSRIDF